MVNILKWFRERKWKHLTIALAVIFSTFTANKALAEYSPKTVNAIKESRVYYEKIKGQKSWSQIEEETMVAKIVAIVHSLTTDVLTDLEKGNYKDALKEFESLRSFAEIADTLGVFEKVADDIIKVNAAIEKVLKEKETGAKKTKRGSLKSGRYIFKSKHFLLDLKIKNKDGQLLVTYQKTGIPLEEGEWETASAGKPESIKKYVLKNILKSKSSSAYMRVRTEGTIIK